MNTKADFEKDLFKLMNNAVFGKTMENVRKHRDIKLVTKKSTEFFTEHLLTIEIKKKEILLNKPVQSGLSILELS